MDYAAVMVMERQASGEKLRGNGHDGTLRTYGRHRGHGYGIIGDASGNDGQNGKLQGVKRKNGGMDSMDMGKGDGNVGEDKTERPKKVEIRVNDVQAKKKKKKKKCKGNTCNMEAEKENKFEGPFSRMNDKSFKGVVDDAGDGIEIGKRKRREKITDTKSVHSFRPREGGRKRKVIEEGSHAQKKPYIDMVDDEKNGAGTKRTPLIKKKKEESRKLKAKDRQGSRRTDKVQETARTRQMNLPKKSIVDPLDTHIRIGDEEDAIAIGSTEGEITQVRGQAIQNGEADVVETFRRHVESERKQLTSLVKQAQIEEINRQEEHAKTIASKAAKALENAHSFGNPNANIEKLTEQNHESLIDPTSPVTLRPHPYRENITALLEQSHTLTSKYTIFQERVTRFLNRNRKEVEQQLVTFMSNRKRKQEELVLVLDDLYAEADKDIRGVIQREESKLKRIRKVVRRVEK